MKKKLTLLMLSALMLTGCGVDGSASSKTKTSESASTTDSEITKAYDSYKANGGTLSYEEWLSSIKGEKGDTGEAGKDGADGKSAYELYCERHPEYKGTEDEWLDDLTTGKLNRITISFDTYGGSTMDDVTTSFGSYITVDAPSRNGYEFDGWTLNGSDIDVNTYVFFASCTLKAKWKKVTYTIKYVLDDGNYKLLSNVLLDAHRFNEDYSGTDENGYYANNYAQSEIRAWLNGTFYDTAFSLDNTAIQTTTVDNSAATTGYTTNTYACENTEDKVYLLSYQDYCNADYGFSDDISRRCKTTDYARAMGVYCDSDYNGYYWTRSPVSFSSNNASYVSSVGSLSYRSVFYGLNSVRPSLSVKIS